MTTDIMFLTHNRLEYARASFRTLIENTNWTAVSRLWLMDDASTDGVRGAIRKDAVQLIHRGGALVRLQQVNGTWGSPVEAMNYFFRHSTADIVCKIDSDVMLPPGWLGECLRLLAQNPGVDLLGIEARGASAAESAPAPCDRKLEESEWIGGIGVFRRGPFTAVPGPRSAASEGRWFGWQGWQIRNRARCVPAWIHPSLQVFLLDRLPMEPWRSLGESYVAKGWMRKPPFYYGEHWAGLWSWAGDYLGGTDANLRTAARQE